MRGKAFKPGEVQWTVLEALKGPMTGPEIVRAIESPLPHKDTYRRMYCVLDRLRRRGMVGREKRVWIKDNETKNVDTVRATGASRQLE